MMVSERTGSKHVRQTSSSYPQWEFDTVGVEPVADIFNEMHDVPDAAVSPNHRSCTVKLMAVGQPCIMRGISVIRTVGQLRIVKGILGRTGATLYFEMDTVPFHRIQTIRGRRWCSVTNCFRMKILPICRCRIMRNCLCQHCRFSRMRGASGPPRHRSDGSDR